jgi:hypothetical protein
MLSGTACWLPIEHRNLFGLKLRVAAELCGFYATRFVEAVSADEAAEKAEALVADELRALVVNGARPFGIAVKEVWEQTVETGGPGAGFTWFQLDSPEMPENRTSRSDGLHTRRCAFSIDARVISADGFTERIERQYAREFAIAKRRAQSVGVLQTTGFSWPRTAPKPSGVIGSDGRDRGFIVRVDRPSGPAEVPSTG